jgi:hypothetical protein
VCVAENSLHLAEFLRFNSPTFAFSPMRPLLRQITNTPRIIRFALLGLAAIWNLPDAEAGITFTPGHIYSTSQFGGQEGYRNIFEYSETGTVLGSLTVPSLLQDDELRGIAFGPDGLLYAVMVHFADSGFQVLALDSSGTVHETYRMEGVYVWGSGSAGKIALDQQYIYVAGGDDLVRFALGNPTSGVSIYTNNQVYDVNILPSGNLFVASAYQIDEVTNTGAFVRTVASSNGTDFVDIWGIAYVPTTNELFVTQLGTTGSKYSILRVNAATGEIETGTLFNYASDLFITESGTLLVGSWTETARIYNQDLIFVGPLGADPRFFVTQYVSGQPTPTPTATPRVTPRPRPTPRARPTAAFRG